MSDSVTSVDSDLAFAGAAAQAGRLRERTVSAPELTRLCLDRIERVDPRINAFRAVRAERALAEAEAAQRRLDAGEHAPLLGVPVAIKDNTDIAGEPTRHGTRLQPEPATADSAVVARLRAAGAVIVGQTNLPELALWGHFTESEAAGVTRNPWDPERGTNGSSGGSAAAVAAGLAGLAHASDGGGSIRLPAAACGLFGLKPQRGRVPLAPDDDHWLGLTQFGPLARHVRDAALFLDATAEPPPGGGTWLDLAAPRERRLRIAVSLKPALPARVRAAARAAVDSTAKLLGDLGHQVGERDPRYGLLAPLFVPRWVAGGHRDAVRLGGPGGMSSATRGIVRMGALAGRPARRSLRREAAYSARLNQVFDDFDVLLTPVTGAQPGAAGAGAGKGMARTFAAGGDYVCFTPPWNFTGQPAASVPAGFDEEGMPTAVQIVAGPGGEATLLALAAEIEQARPWADRRPPAATA